METRGTRVRQAVHIPCIVCGRELRPQQELLTCEYCTRKQHRTCGNTGITREHYRISRRTQEPLHWQCSTCALREDDLLAANVRNDPLVENDHPVEDDPVDDNQPVVQHDQTKMAEGGLRDFQTMVASKIRQFNLDFNPAGITCTPDGNIVVCKHCGSTVSMYDPNGQKLFDLQIPSGSIVWDAECTLTNIYVTEYNKNSVLVFTHNGAFVKSIKIDNVSGVTGISKLSNYTTPMYITENRSNTVREVVRSQADNMSSQKVFAAGLKLANPHFICARNRSVAISSYNDHCVHVTDLTGQKQFTYGTPGQPGTGPNLLTSPLGVAFDTSNRLFIANSNKNTVCVVTDQGSLLGEINLQNDNVKTILGITINDQGELLVAGYYSKNVTIYQYTVK